MLRLCCIYALLDCSPMITLPHLEAALAVWRYAEASVECVFGETLGSPLAAALISELRRRPGGMTRTEVRDYFGRHKEKEEIDAALAELKSAGKAYETTEQTGGRSRERWHAVMQRLPDRVEVAL